MFSSQRSQLGKHPHPISSIRFVVHVHGTTQSYTPTEKERSPESNNLAYNEPLRSSFLYLLQMDWNKIKSATQ